MLYDHLTINEAGHLAIGGVDAAELAKEFGTPLYVLDSAVVRERCRTYMKGVKAAFGPSALPLYASKALSCKAIYRIAAAEGMGADVVSSGELATAVAAGFPADRLFFHGNAKTDDDLRYGMEQGVGWFVVDGPEELIRLNELAKEKGIRQPILFRLTPGIDPHTFEAVNTGKVDSKFGLVIENGQARAVTEFALGLGNIRLDGFHCHIGSQIFDAQPFCDAIDIMLDFIAMCKKELHYTAPMLDIGGGFGVRYTEADPIPDYRAMLNKIGDHYMKSCMAHHVTPPVIRMEPGRSLVADAGVTLYHVQSVKTIPGYKNYVSVNGGMADNPRQALYGARYTAVLAERPNDAADFPCDIAGCCCESGDLISTDMHLPHPKRGELLAVFTTGAYNFSMASSYNRLRRPPLVMVENGKATLAVRGETFDDLMACDL